MSTKSWFALYRIFIFSVIVSQQSSLSCVLDILLYDAVLCFFSKNEGKKQEIEGDGTKENGRASSSSSPTAINHVPANQIAVCSLTAS